MSQTILYLEDNHETPKSATNVNEFGPLKLCSGVARMVSRVEALVLDEVIVDDFTRVPFFDQHEKDQIVQVEPKSDLANVKSINRILQQLLVNGLFLRLSKCSQNIDEPLCGLSKSQIWSFKDGLFSFGQDCPFSIIPEQWFGDEADFVS